MGFVTLGIFSLDRSGIEGAILQMINHGIITGALFLCVGMIYERTHTREVAQYGGLFKVAPIYSTFLALFCLAAAGTPGLNSFVGEFLIILGAFRVWPWIGAMAVWGVALGAAYVLWLFYRMVIGELGPGVRGAATRPQRPRSRDPRAPGRAGRGHRPLSGVRARRPSRVGHAAAGGGVVERRNCGATVRDLLLLFPELVLAGAGLVLIVAARRVAARAVCRRPGDRGGGCRRLRWLCLLHGRPERGIRRHGHERRLRPVFQGPLRGEPGVGGAPLRETSRCGARSARRVLFAAPAGLDGHDADRVGRGVPDPLPGSGAHVAVRLRSGRDHARQGRLE